MNRRIAAIYVGWAVLAGFVPAQQTTPVVITLPDALARARQYGGQIQSANFAVLQAREDTKQARAAPTAIGKRVQPIYLHRS